MSVCVFVCLFVCLLVCLQSPQQPEVLLANYWLGMRVGDHRVHSLRMKGIISKQITLIWGALNRASHAVVM